MAAKHDNKHARANMWVTHQNLARQKGGRPGYQFKERKLPIPVRKPVVTKPAEAAPPITDATPSEE